MREMQSAMVVFLLLTGACAAEDELVRAEVAELSAQSAAGSSSLAGGEEGGDQDPEGGLTRRTGTTHWDPPQDPCDQGNWSVCGQDNSVRKSQFNTCLAGFCLSCRMATESISCPGVWEWCDQSSSPCMIPSDSWAN
jgi:hypothetical protein